MTASWVRQKANSTRSGANANANASFNIEDTPPQLCGYFEEYDKNGSLAGIYILYIIYIYMMYIILYNVYNMYLYYYIFE